MIEPEQLVSVLQEMAAAPAEELHCPWDPVMPASERAQRDHVEFLVGAGHAEWTSRAQTTARITNAGYDVVDAVGAANGVIDALRRHLNDGMTWVHACRKIVGKIT